MNKLFLLLVLPGLVLAGCGTGEIVRIDPGESVAAAPPSPKDQIEREMLAKATEGLRFGQTVTVLAAAKNDRALAKTLAAQAEKVTAERNSWPVSVGAFRDAVVADPSYAPAYEGLGRALLMEGKVAMAQAAFRTAIAKDAKNLDARYNLGMTRQMDGDYRAAVSEWQRLVDLAPSYKDAYARMAIASYFAQDYKAAEDYLAKAKAMGQEVPPQFEPLLKEAQKKA